MVALYIRKLGKCRAFIILECMEKEFDIILGKIYLLYYKAKIYLGEAHLIQTPKGYLEKFNIDMPFKCDLDILDYLVGRRTSTYSTLSNKCWILFVLEITKILSYRESFGIGKLYNKILNRNIDTEIQLECFRPILQLIDNKCQTGIVNKLMFLRDKHYAHTDAEVEQLTNRLFPTYNEAWDMMFVIEQFLKDIYGQKDSDVDLEINRHFNGYLREFRRTYEYFKTIQDPIEKMILRNHFDNEKIQAYFESQE